MNPESELALRSRNAARVHAVIVLLPMRQARRSTSDVITLGRIPVHRRIVAE